MHVANMRMLWCMCEHIRSDKIRNEDIRDKVGVASQDEGSDIEVAWRCEENLKEMCICPMWRC